MKAGKTIYLGMIKFLCRTTNDAGTFRNSLFKSTRTKINLYDVKKGKKDDQGKEKLLG